MDKVSELPMATHLETAGGKLAGKHENNPNSLRSKLLIATAVVVTAVGAVAAVKYLPTFLENRAAQTETVSEPIIPRLPSDHWQIIPQNEISKYTKPSAIDGDVFEGKKRIDTAGAPISPILQEKAKAAGYTITYQYDPNDTTGHSILTTDRNNDLGNSHQDDAFGIYETSMPQIRGIFKAWVPRPSDPQQKNDVYALLENPLTKETFLVAITFRSRDSIYGTTLFTVDDLNYGWADVLKMKQITHNGLGSIGMPDDPNDPSKKSKTLYDFPTFNDLFKKNATLDNIMQPGNYIKAFVGLTDKDGVRTAGLVIGELFGGMAEWEKEAGIR
ncbi:MAG: hypothetical protein HW400_219 [Candidatus Levybacteria bacterium]|nr:hypothetical protein [Candidatus Levybacteria bacterium]